MPQAQPNILLIMSDQLIPEMTGAYGNPIAQTPNIDRLAARGTLFSSAYTSCPICAPARMSLLTGQYVSAIGCHDNTSILASDEPTFNHYLSAAGYDTVLTGKMHMIGPDQLHGYARRLNTDIYPSDFAWLGRRVAMDDFSGIHENPIAVDYVGEGAGVRQWSLQLDYDEETHFRALEYLRYKKSEVSGTLQKPMPVRDDAPFMLHVSYQHPHEPFHCTQEYWDRYEGVDIPIPQIPADMAAHQTAMDRSLNTWHGCGRVDLMNPDSLRVVHRSYLANVTYLDDKIGELLDTLEHCGLADDTLIIFCSDHGDMLGHRGMVQKRTFYEQASRINLIVSMPERLRRGTMATPGSVCHDPVSIVDIMPTLLDLAGIETDLPMDGRSLRPQLMGESDPARHVFCEHHVEGVTACCFMVRRGAFKLNLTMGGEAQLFDLRADPGEWRNLAGDPAHAAIEAELRALIAARFDREAIERAIALNLRKRWVIKAARQQTGGPSWDYQPHFDASKQYWREG